MPDDISSVDLAADLTVAWLANPNTRTSAQDVPAFLNAMHQALCQLEKSAEESPNAPSVPEHAPAVSVRKSLADRDHIISMIDGRPYKSLRRHIAGHGLTPEQYRERYKLKSSYPMVAPGYSERRSAMAKALGLGRKPNKPSGEPGVEDQPSKPHHSRKSKAEAKG